MALDRFKDWFKEKEQLISENTKIRKSKKNIEEKYNKLLEEKDELNSKYIYLLEQKSEQFDLYVKYQNQCVDLATEKRELKKQLADSNISCNSLLKDNQEYELTIEKLERKIKRMEKKNEQSA